MDSALRTISYIADIGSIVVLMARQRMSQASSEDFPESPESPGEGPSQYRMICYVFESEDVSLHPAVGGIFSKLFCCHLIKILLLCIETTFAFAVMKNSSLGCVVAPKRCLFPAGAAHRTVHRPGLQRGLQGVPARQRHQPHRPEPEAVQ